MSQSTAERQLPSVVNPESDPHINGQYLQKNPTWHVEYSPQKADTIFRLLQRNKLQPRAICEVGCGAGEVLRQLQLKMPQECRFWGFDIAPDAIRMARERENERLRFALSDFVAIETPPFDLMLVLEVVDHVEDYLRFLRQLKHRAGWKIFSFTLDISVQSVLRDPAFTKARHIFEHLHHFNKEIALATLQHAGYEVLDCCYGQNNADTAAAKLIKPFRALSFALNQDVSVRVFGGRSLVVLTR
jgi:cyclopropane fatty-acyl-phospholipid synthase-like methyltransferase